MSGVRSDRPRRSPLEQSIDAKFNQLPPNSIVAVTPGVFPALFSRSFSESFAS